MSEWGNRKCVVCGAEFEPRYASQITCSDACQRKRKNAQERACRGRRKDRINALREENKRLALILEEKDGEALLKENAELRATLEERDKKIAELSAATMDEAILDAARKKLDGVEMIADTLRKENAAFRAALEAKEKELAPLKAALRAKDEEIVALKNAIDAKEQEFAAKREVAKLKEQEAQAREEAARKNAREANEKAVQAEKKRLAREKTTEEVMNRLASQGLLKTCDRLKLTTMSDLPCGKTDKCWWPDPPCPKVEHLPRPAFAEGVPWKRGGGGSDTPDVPEMPEDI